MHHNAVLQYPSQATAAPFSSLTGPKVPIHQLQVKRSSLVPASCKARQLCRPAGP